VASISREGMIGGVSRATFGRTSMIGGLGQPGRGGED
jgi:hypothetical protein